jgi:hypothetical protein
MNTVIVTHTGHRPYLEACLRRAVASTPGGRVVLLGDAANAMIGVGEHHSIDDPALREDIDDFRDVYRQVSTAQAFTRERFWVERWFLIRNFLRRERLSGCLAIDSDVLLFCNVAEEAERFRSYAMTFGRWDAVRVVPHCNFINGLDGLESFCRYVLELYRDPERLSRLTEINRKKFNFAWISDMSLLAAWGATSGFPVGYLEDTVASGVAFDSCLDDPRGYVPCGFLPGVLRQWKKIVFRDGVPHGIIRSNRLVVPMRCLHYHGRMKLLLPRHAAGQEDDWSAARMLATEKFASYPGKVRLFRRTYVDPLLPAPLRSRREA